MSIFTAFSRLCLVVTRSALLSFLCNLLSASVLLIPVSDVHPFVFPLSPFPLALTKSPSFSRSLPLLLSYSPVKTLLPYSFIRAQVDAQSDSLMNAARHVRPEPTAYSSCRIKPFLGMPRPLPPPTPTCGRWGQPT